MPKGYFLSEVDVANPEANEAYRTRVLPTAKKFGGRFLVRGGQPKASQLGSTIMQTCRTIVSHKKDQ